jgi:hypothetical protein
MASYPVTTNTLLTTTPQAVYTPSAGYNCWVDAFSISNNAPSDAVVTIWRDQSASNSIVLPGKTLATEQSYAVVELIGQWIKDGGAIVAKADTPSVVAVIFSGREFANVSRAT